MLATLAIAAAAAAPLSFTATPAAVAPGGSLSITYAAKHRPAKLVLRLDGKQLKTVKVRKARGRTTVALPRDIRPGAHRLTACVKKLCRSRTFRVTRAAAAPAPVPAAAASSSGQPAPAAPAPAPTPAPPSPPPPTATAKIDFTGKPNPLDVQAHADAAHRATKTIDVAGGTLETTGADGTKYKLTVPPNALLSAAQISMSPLTSVGDLPFSGGLAAGVQLEPSGLRFADFVTLEISNHKPVSAQEESAFLYQRAGDEFQLYPATGDATKTTFKIMHFSGVGIAKGTEAERNAQLLRATTDVEGRVYQLLNSLFRRGQPDDLAQVDWVLRIYHDQVVKPLMTAALTDDGLAIQAINKYLAWGRLVQLWAGDDFMVAERQALTDQWIAIMKNAAIKAHKRCVEENRPEELPTILSWWRQLALMGLTEEMPTDLWSAIESCARFELDFHTKITQEQGGEAEGPELWKGEVLAENVMIEPDPVTLQQRGTRDAQYVDFRIVVPPHKPGTGCWMGSDEWTTTFPFKVSRLEMDLNPIQRPDGSYGYPQLERGNIRVEVLPFTGHEHVFYADCNGSDPEGGVWDSWMAETFMVLHEDQLGEFGGMVFTNWTVPSGGGSMIGAKTYFRTKTVDTYKTTEETTLELYHAPKR